MMGATVTTQVALSNLWAVLQIFEHHSDIHIIERQLVPDWQTEIWTLRSDRFPPSWEGILVVAKITSRGRLPPHLCFHRG